MGIMAILNNSFLFCYTCTFTPHYLLLILEVDRKSVYRRKLQMHCKLKEPPTGINWSNVSCIEVLLNLIQHLTITLFLNIVTLPSIPGILWSIGLSNSNCSHIWALVNVLVDVL